MTPAPAPELNPTLWQEALDAMDAGIVLYGADDRLRLCNRGFRVLYRELEDLLQPGVAFEEMLRAAIARDLIPEAGADVEAFVAQRLAEHRAPREPLLRRLADGRWRRITEQRLGDGSLLAFSIDVTELVESRLALQDARDEARRTAQRLEDAVEALPAGFELYDADDRLVLYNSMLRDMYPRVAAQMAQGRTFEELIRANIAAGALPGVGEADEAWLARRLAERRQPHAPIEQQLEGGRWIRIHERCTRDGGLVGVRVDITELMAQRAAAEQASARLNDAIEALPEGFALYDADDRLVACNERYRELYAASAPAMRPGTGFETILRYGLARGQYPAAAGQEQAWLEERLYRHRHPGEPLLQELPGNRWLRIDERRTRLGGIAGVRTDVTELVRRGQQLQQLNRSLAESRAQLHAVIGTALSAILTLDENDLVLSANPATTQIFGWTEAELVGRPLGALLPELEGHEETRPAPLPGPAGVASNAGVPVETAGRHRDGTRLTVQLALSQLNLPGARRFVALITDLSEREAAAQALRDANARLARLSDTDALTGIANRRRFDRDLADEWQRAVRHGTPLALLIVDVDHFKRYNDSLGHPQGDACLRRIAELLQGCARRAGDLVARYGGEEFALLLPHTGADEAVQLAQRCIATVDATALPHPESPVARHVTLSIGVAAALPDEDTLSASLVRAADAAVYAAKRAGRHRAVLAG